MKMNEINIGLIGYGTVGSGVLELLSKRKAYIKNKFRTKFSVKSICDLDIKKKNIKGAKNILLTNNYKEVLNNKDVDVIVELIGGINPARTIVVEALKKGKHVVTANKALISNFGKELFKLAKENNCNLYYESSVGAGVPIIKNLTEGIAGNKVKSLLGIINGTCNFILSEMTYSGLSFSDALKKAQKKGYAESNPTLDINGMDSAHKLAIMAYLAFGKFIDIKDIYTEGISHISHNDIEYAESLGLIIKLLTIAKKDKDTIEARVHPTLIPKEHSLASINNVNNAIFIEADPLGDILISGEGAGKMAAASGVVSDLINLANKGYNENLVCNFYSQASNLKLKKIDQIKTKFYIRLKALDKPGVLSKITGILGKYGIGINSVTQKIHKKASAVPVVLLTDYTTEKSLRAALNKIKKLTVIKGEPVAIRMEKL